MSLFNYTFRKKMHQNCEKRNKTKNQSKLGSTYIKVSYTFGSNRRHSNVTTEPGFTVNIYITINGLSIHYVSRSVTTMTIIQWEPYQTFRMENFKKCLRVTSATKLFCHEVGLDAQLMNFFYLKWKCFVLEISRFLCFFVKFTDSKICDVIIGIAT